MRLESPFAAGATDPSHHLVAHSAATRASTNGRFAAVPGMSVGRSRNATGESVRSAVSTSCRRTGSGRDPSLQQTTAPREKRGEPHAHDGKRITLCRWLTAAANADSTTIDCSAGVVTFPSPWRGERRERPQRRTRCWTSSYWLARPANREPLTFIPPFVPNIHSTPDFVEWNANLHRSNLV
jgi:hypothetical protein